MGVWSIMGGAKVGWFKGLLGWLKNELWREWADGWFKRVGVLAWWTWGGTISC
jgi:hypothetical protein